MSDNGMSIELSNWIRDTLPLVLLERATKIEKTFTQFSVSMYQCGSMQQSLIRIDVKPNGPKTD